MSVVVGRSRCGDHATASSPPASRSRRRRACRCSSAAATPSTPRLRPTPSWAWSSRSRTASAATCSRSSTRRGPGGSAWPQRPRVDAARADARRSSKRSGSPRCRRAASTRSPCPGAVAGWEALRARLGTLPMADLLAAAICVRGRRVSGVGRHRGALGRRSRRSSSPSLAPATPTSRRPRAARRRDVQESRPCRLRCD